MSDPPIHDLDNDVEKNLTAVNIIAPNKLFYEIVEVVDLTEDEFMKEFKTFLNTITDHRLDVDTRRCGTKAKSKLVINTLSVPVVLLCNVRIHQDTFICELFRLNFSNTMIYGMLTTEMYKDDVTIYQLDDGTATVDVYYRPSNNNMLDYLCKLNSCEDALRRKSSPMNEESIPLSAQLKRHLRLLISRAKSQCHKHIARLKLRTHCFVIGRPFVGSGGNIAVYAETVLPDAELNHSCELFWKSFLLAVYDELLIESIDRDDSTDNLSERLSKISL